MAQPFALSETSIARGAVLLTPSDSVDLVKTCRALWVGNAGNVKLTALDGSTVVFSNVYGVLPIAVVRVYATLTTATNIVALY